MNIYLYVYSCGPIHLYETLLYGAAHGGAAAAALAPAPEAELIWRARRLLLDAHAKTGYLLLLWLRLTDDGCGVGLLNGLLYACPRRCKSRARSR